LQNPVYLATQNSNIAALKAAKAAWEERPDIASKTAKLDA
jgi:hypothetical protein